MVWLNDQYGRAWVSPCCTQKRIAAKCCLIQLSTKAWGQMTCLKWSVGPEDWVSLLEICLQRHSYGLWNSEPLGSYTSLLLISFSMALHCCFFSLLLLFWPANFRFSGPWTIAVTLLGELRNSLTERLGFKQMSHHISVNSQALASS